MGFVKKIPVVGSLISGPVGERWKDAGGGSEVPKPQPAPEVAEPEPTLLQEDPENRVAKQRKRRASAATQQSGMTILGAGTEGLGGSRTPGG